MNTARMRIQRSAVSNQRSVRSGPHTKLLTALLACAVTASVSCGPDGKMSFGGSRGAAQRNPSPGPLAGPMPPFSTTDANANPATAGQNDPAAGPVDARVQSFVGQFPPDDRDRQGRKPPAQSPDPTIKPAAQAATAKPPGPVVVNTGKTAPTATQPAAVANRPVTQAMQPVAAQVGPPAPDPAAQAPGGADAQASPQPMKIDLSPPSELTRPRVELIDVRPANMPTTMPSAAAAAAPPANQPVVQTGATRGNDLASMLVELEEAVQAHPEQLDNQFKLRLLYLATDQDEKANGPIAAGDPAQAHLTTALFDVMTSTKAVMRQPTTSPAPALLAAEELRRLLGQQSPVIIPKIALVTRVNSFGDYDAVSPARFAAGQGVHVFVYTEVSNFRSEPTPDGRLRTLLAETVEIYDATGKVIWKQTADNIEDKVLSPRRDFFVPVEVRLPPSTPPGEYVLKASIEDKLGATTDQQKMTFVIE